MQDWWSWLNERFFGDDDKSHFGDSRDCRATWNHVLTQRLANGKKKIGRTYICAVGNGDFSLRAFGWLIIFYFVRDICVAQELRLDVDLSRGYALALTYQWIQDYTIFPSYLDTRTCVHSFSNVQSILESNSNNFKTSHYFSFTLKINDADTFEELMILYPFVWILIVRIKEHLFNFLSFNRFSV